MYVFTAVPARKPCPSGTEVGSLAGAQHHYNLRRKSSSSVGHSQPGSSASVSDANLQTAGNDYIRHPSTASPAYSTDGGCGSDSTDEDALPLEEAAMTAGGDDLHRGQRRGHQRLSCGTAQSCSLTSACRPEQRRPKHHGGHYLQNELPDEVLLNVFSYLLEKDVLSMIRVCKRFSQIGNDSQIWLACGRIEINLRSIVMCI